MNSGNTQKQELPVSFNIGKLGVDYMITVGRDEIVYRFAGISGVL